MPYLGNEPAAAFTSTTKDSFSGDGSTTAFTMSKSANVNAVRVVVENVIQDPTVAYTCSGTTLTFTSAPPSGTNNIYVVHLGPPAATVAPPTTINNATTYTDALTVNGAFTSQGIDDNADATAITIDSSENVGIGTTSPTAPLDVRISGASGKTAEFHNNSGYGVDIGSDSNSVAYISSGYTQALAFKTDPSSGQTERMRIDDAGRVMIGTTTEGAVNEAEDFTISSTGGVGMTIRSTDSGTSRIYFSDATSGTGEYAGYIIYNHSDERLIFGVNSTEQLRFTNDKQILIGNTGGVGSSQAGVQVAGTDGYNFWRSATTATTGYDQCVYINGNGVVGRITTSGSSTSYATSSDYRLKENVTDISDGITRVKQLSPKRFNWIADADTTVDGFLAHEAATVVPEAVTGTKDAVEVWKEHEELPDGVSVGDNKLDDDGNTIPDHQGIDQAKLVPLLTAALQEAIAKIETLETKVAALEAG